MTNKKLQKAISFLVAFALLLSGISGVAFPIVKADTGRDIYNAAKTYIDLNQNEVTLEGLLTAVQIVNSEVTLSASDFYIKHAVPGVKDVMADGSENEYPLNIEGSDGAVAAIFEYDGNRYPFVYAFEHEVETIEINEVAVVGKDSGFSYGGSANGGRNVTAYAGTADKIVFPADYKGTMAVAAVNNVKVVIYNSGVPFFGNAFKGSPSLKAVQINNGDTAFKLASKTNVWSTVTKAENMFSACPELKYFKLPNNIANEGEHYWFNMFPNGFLKDCPKLENVVMAKTATGCPFSSYGYHAFYGTAVRDVVMPSSPAAITKDEGTFGGTTVANGTRNIHHYTDEMTFVRAVALAAAAVNVLDINENEATIINAAKSAITGSADSESFKNGLNFSFKEDASETKITKIVGISNGTDKFEVTISASLILSDLDAAFDIAKDFVAEKGNEITAQELLEVVQGIVPEVTLNAENDFYIKHAIPGVMDVMADGSENEYPLNIEGSDGAVAAIFEYDGNRYPFVCAFEHEVEIIEIKEVAVVGKSSVFNYGGSANGGKNVTAYSGKADKIVFPADYKGTMALPAVNNVKVVIYNSGVPFFGNAFKGSDSLKAVQINNGDTAFQLGSKTNVWSTEVKAENMFSACPELKYFKLPDNITNDSKHYWFNMFPNGFLKDCPKLENVVMAKTATGCPFSSYGYQAFYGTAVRDVVMPSSPAAITKDEGTFGGTTVANGTRNIHNYTDEMTFVRAVALAAAAVNTLSIDDDKATIIDTVKSAITGSADSESFKNSLEFSFEEKVSDTEVAKVLAISNGTDKFDISILGSLTLSDLSVTDYDISPVFNASVLEYTVSVPCSTRSVEIEAIPVEGATVGEITGNVNLVVGNNTVTIPVTTANSKTVNYTITVVREEFNPNDGTFDIVKNFVVKKGNALTAQELLEELQKIVPEATLDAENDFYIKHAVPGVKDVMADGSENEYPLNIEGSDGAVAAVFEVNGKRHGFTCAFPHEVETIEINEVAVVGKDSGFSYGGSANSGKNVVGYTGTADKIVFPAGYQGTMAVAAVNNVKVVIYNNGVPFFGNAFKGSPSLKAVQIDNGDTALQLASKVNVWSTATKASGMFSECPELKYFKLPNTIANDSTNYWFNMFPNGFLKNCPKLENVVMAKTATGCPFSSYGYQVFYGTAIRDVVLPTSPAAISIKEDAFGGTTVANGTRNIHEYTDKMTFVRAAALAAAAVNELGIDATSDVALDTAKNAIKGSEDASSFADALTFALEGQWVDNDYVVKGTLTVSDRQDTIPLDFIAGKALEFLDVGFAMTPAFAPDVTQYRVNVTSRVSKLNINATLADGAELKGISGNEELKFGVPKVITISVLTSQGKTVDYKITATLQTPPEINDALISKIQAYAQSFVADNYSTEEKYTTYLSEYNEDLGITVTPLNFYKYNSIPGATEGSEILVPGHKGYLSAEIEISNGTDKVKTVVLTTIEPYMKNYEFSSDEISKKEDFELSKDGKTLLWYSGDAKKIVIPDGVVSIDMGWYAGENMNGVKVIIMPDSVEEIPDSFCYNMTGLEAVYLSDNIISLPTSAFGRCYYLQFIHLPEELGEIGYGAFMFAMSMPEMYFPSTLESIGTKAFWTAGIRNYNLPKKLTNVASDGICYPPIAGGIWNEPDAQSKEMAADITALMNSYQFNKNNVMITVFGPNLALASTSSFTASNYQVTGAQVHVRAPSSFATTVFEGKISKWNTYKYFDNMTMSEIAARAQFAIDHVLLLKTATEQQVESAINDAYYTNTENTLSWIEPYTVTDGVATGTIKLSSGDTSVNLLLNREIYTPPVSTGGSILKGDKSDIKLDINFDESLFDDDSDKEDVKEPDVDFDSFDDKDDVVVDTDKGEVTVEIRLNKVPENKLGENIISKFKGYPYVAFDLSLYSEEAVQPNGKLGIAVPLPEGFDGKLCSIYYVTDDGEFVDMDAKMYGEDMAFYTSELGRYVLVMDGTDYTPIYIAVAVGGGVLLLGIAALVVLLIIRKKRNAK